MRKLVWFLLGFVVFGCIAASTNNLPIGTLRLNEYNCFTAWDGKEWKFIHHDIPILGKHVYDCGLIRGHDFKYVRVTYTGARGKAVVYKCDKCNHIIRKYLDEITQKEKEALQLLGIIE